MLGVTGSDNRGTDEVPFGYVYFNDDSRVLYAGTDVRSLGGRYWRPSGQAHIDLAVEYLAANTIRKAA